MSPFNLQDIPWIREGFYYSSKDEPGKHPYHEAGLYYIQEPSAMAVGELMDPKPGEKILDLCAAPGGKATHIATKLKGKGVLLANEIHPQRARVLSQNIERMGIKNAVVTNETPNRLARRFPNYFDRILETPCSGEGMFRKNPKACAEWSLDSVSLCRDRQLDILEYAKDMLKPGGRLVYSTCTFSPEENEGVISEFVKFNPDFGIEDVKIYNGFDRGRADWAFEGLKDIENAIRIWPHKVRGEGHYIAILHKLEGKEAVKVRYAEGMVNKGKVEEYLKFAEEFLLDTPRGKYILFGDQLYIIPLEMLPLNGLKVLRPGWHLGTFKKNRFEPSHALALSLKGKDAKYTWSLDRNSHEVMAYLRGEAIEAMGPKGWYLVEVDGYSIGWGKLSNNLLKNHYPKGLRWNIYV